MFGCFKFKVTFHTFRGISKPKKSTIILKTEHAKLGLVKCCFNSIKARFKRRILHAPNRIAKLTTCKMRRLNQLRTFARNFSNIDFFLKILPLKDDELVMSEMQKKWGVTDFVLERT